MKEFKRDKVTLLHADCMEYMKDIPDNTFDLAIVDPPYGIGMGGGITRGENIKYTDKRSGSKTNIIRRDYGNKKWDDDIPHIGYFNELRRITLDQIIWGGNYFITNLKSTNCFIVWDKVNGKTNQSDCELAWTSFKTTTRLIRFMWNGFNEGKSIKEGNIKQGNYDLCENRIHPTQKPIKLYKWLLKNYATPDMKIIDTHLGSGSSAIAAHDFGCEFVGCEIDYDYYTSSVKRFDMETRQQKLF